MSKITIPDIASQFASQEALNARFTQVENELNNKVLYRDNPDGEPNAMAQELDMNSNRVINLLEPVNPNDAARLQDVTTSSLDPDTVIATQTEAVTLTAGQTTVVFTAYETTGSSFNISGPNTDDSRLVLGRDFSVPNSTTILLTQSYPAGTLIQLLRNKVAGGGDTIVVEAQGAYDTVAQMKGSTPAVGELISTKGYYVAGDGGGASYLVAASQTVDGYGDHDLAGGTVVLLQAGTLVSAKQYGAKYDNATDDSAAHNAGLAALSAAGGGVLSLPSGTTRANIVNTFDKVGIIGEGRSTVIAPLSGIGLQVNGISGGFGSLIHNFTVSGVNGCDTGLYIDGFSRGKFGDLWLIDSLDIALDIDGDGSTEFTFENVYINNPISWGVRYLRTDGVDTGGVYFDTLHVTGGITSAIGLEASSTHTSRTRAFMFINKLIIDNRFVEAILLKNTSSFFFSQVWATGSIASKGMLTLQDVKDCFIDQAWLQNSNAGGYNLLISGGGTSLETADLSLDQLRTSGPGTAVQFNGSPALTRCKIDGWNDTSSTKTNDAIRLSQMRSMILEGDFTVEGKTNFGGAFGTLTLNGGGAVTATSSAHRIAPEAGAADDMHTISGGTQGDRLTIMVNSSANTITVKHGTGNIFLDGASDKVLDNSRDKLELVYFNGEWQQSSFSSNG